MTPTSTALRAAAALLISQADMSDIAAEHDIKPSATLVQLPGPIPPEFYAVSATNPYGARADIGSPNNQAILRAYALRDGFSDLNHYIKSKWTPIWPDTKREPSPGYAGDQS